MEKESRCDRCGGLMQYDYFANITEGGVYAWACQGWRCLYCGEVIDPLILSNRRKVEESRGKERRGLRSSLQPLPGDRNFSLKGLL